MELSQLRYFLKVAEARNFTHAGEQLGITQPALSRSIARLEEELGLPLFERQARVLSLTDAGQRLRLRAERIIAMADDAVAELTDDGQTGIVRVGAIPTIAPYLLPRLLQAFRLQAPQAQVVVIEETTDKLLQRCHHGEVDLALLAAPIGASHLEVVPLFDEELLLVSPTGHPLTRRKQVTMTDLRGYPFVLLEETHCLTQTVVSFCQQRTYQPVSIERTSQLATVLELVALHHGISLIPHMARQHDIDSRRIYRSIGAPKPTRRIVLVWNSYRFQSRLAKRFMEEVRRLTTINGQTAASKRDH